MHKHRHQSHNYVFRSVFSSISSTTRRRLRFPSISTISNSRQAQLGRTVSETTTKTCEEARPVALHPKSPVTLERRGYTLGIDPLSRALSHGICGFDAFSDRRQFRPAWRRFHKPFWPPLQPPKCRPGPGSGRFNYRKTLNPFTKLDKLPAAAQGVARVSVG